MTNLSFDTLRRANKFRLGLFKNSKGDVAHATPDGSDWTIQEWMNALLGEVGETANILKKVRRNDMTLDEALPALSNEFADTFVYFDLTLNRIGVPLIFQYGSPKSGDDPIVITSFGQFTEVQKATMADFIAKGAKITKTKSELFVLASVSFGRMMDCVTKLDELSALQVSRPDLADTLVASIQSVGIELRNNSVNFFCTVAATAIECDIDLSTAIMMKFNSTSTKVGANVFINEDGLVIDHEGSEITDILPGAIDPELAAANDDEAEEEVADYQRLGGTDVHCDASAE